MANRPRRPNSDQPHVEGAPAEDDAAAHGPDAAIPGETGAETGAAGPDTSAAARPASSLPLPEEQPAGTSLASASDQAAGEDARIGARATPAAETTGAFAAEEGFAGEPAGRRHLGEFEDDETLSPDEAGPKGPRPVTDAFARNEHAAPSAQGGGGSLGALLGAAFAGAAIALVAGALLLRAGVVPGLGTPAASTEQFAAQGDVDVLSGEVGTLRTEVDQLRSAQAAGGATTSYASATDLTMLSDRLTQAEQRLQAFDGEAPQALQTAQSAEETAGGASEAASAAQSAADEARQTAQSAQTRAEEAASQIAEFETRIVAIEDANRRAASALAAASLKAAIDRGGPFTEELDGFAAVNGGGEAVDALRAYAEAGVETPAELLAEWPEAEADMRQTLSAPAVDTGVGDRLMAGLSSLVTIRPTGEAAAGAEGDEAVLARMGGALSSGDLAGFLAERASLPPESQAASQDFADRVEARRRAGEIVDDTLGAIAAAGTAG